MNTILKLSLLSFFCFHLGLMISFNTAYLVSYNSDDLEINPVAQKVFDWTCYYYHKINYPKIPAVQNAVEAYSRLTGANTGYGFFSPNVPSEIAIFFEFKNPDGQVLVQPPILHSKYGMKRFTASLATLRSMENLRPIITRTWAVRMLEQFPNSNDVTVHVGTVHLPSMIDYKKGDRQKFIENYSYQFLLNI